MSKNKEALRVKKIFKRAKQSKNLQHLDIELLRLVIKILQAHEWDNQTIFQACLQACNMGDFDKK